MQKITNLQENADWMAVLPSAKDYMAQMAQQIQCFPYVAPKNSTNCLTGYRENSVFTVPGVPCDLLRIGVLT